MRKYPSYLFILLVVLIFASCSTTKFVPEGEYLLDEVKITSNKKELKTVDLQPYIRQNPNSKWFSVFKTPLYVYNLSGTKHPNRWYNKFFRKIGDPPVIYNTSEAGRSQDELRKAVQNMGYLSAEVDTLTHSKKKKIKLSYNIVSGKPYLVRNITRLINDAKIAKYLEEDSISSLLKPGMKLDVSVLDSERERIVRKLSNVGYYKFHKDYITYSADTVLNTYEIDLTLNLHPYKDKLSDAVLTHPQYRINKVGFITNFDLMQSSDIQSISVNDSLHYNNMPIYYKDKLYLRPKILTEASALKQGELYNASDVQRTYSNFGRLGALKYTNVHFAENASDSTLLNAYVLLTRAKDKSVSFEIDGTNSAGDLGAAAAVSFQHRNLFKGSETFNVRLRGAYEAISNLPGYNNKNYTEYGAEMNINFPRFLFPFVSSDFKKKIRASTEFGIQYNYQIRPEFSRIQASSNWSYKWQKKLGQQFRIDLLDINYLYMPSISDKFKNDYLDGENNYILEYNYKDRLILGTGFHYTYNSARFVGLGQQTNLDSYTIRFGIESAGNLLYGLSNLTNASKNGDGEYKLLSIPYAQYLKGDFSFARNIVVDERNSFAFHVGVGIAYPYGNAGVIPFEKRYFSGGANSVRGWSVRGLGPGSFAGDGNFLNQSGDIKLDVNLEYRTNLFWKLRGAVFVDAGNIWTIREYDTQPGGQFKFNEFYRQIAISYGLGLRFDFDFFVVRLDGGMKAINPEFKSGKERYPIINPKFGRDFAFHFAVGYPF
ncbi:surface antigen (D15) [Bacteroides coprosuis DSM 18011]|uniref:Surface antigen (D15) n=1 Tax=Bacteroides coprosuis DSM 18011 TaxID=679937 RepID=F3ZPE6_9BACE|nr:MULTISPECIES: BamA/TamA family outer membrane protein [Bacteroides]EGJ71603.1 surface antigen (D15) [Bacteroides coprosuis DSM 18011]HJD92571.1 BamA/TamA family outer membrane protein [Bacteroides coprosuis]